jgi:chromate transport protein ChrA
VESSRSKWQQHVGWHVVFTYGMAGSKYVMTILPNILLSIAFWLIHEKGHANAAQLTIYGISIVALLWVLTTAWYTSSLYLRMSHQT